MEVSYVSTRALNEGNRLSVLKLQQQLVVAQKELSSRRHADVGATLGARTTQTISLRQEVSRLEITIDTNASVQGRVSVSQEALEGLSDTAQQFVSTLLGARNSATGPSVAANAGRANLVAFTATMNTTFAGQHIFAGENVEVQPLNDYFATPTPANRQAVNDAFQSFFGFAQDDPQVANITAPQLQNFLDTSFEALFEEPSWSANWSNASDNNLQSRISNLETVETSTNANEDGFRKLAMAFTMMADLGVPNMNRETFQVVADAAIKVAGEAVQDVAVEQARLGTSEARIATVNTKMSAQIDVLTGQVNNLEAVDEFEAAVRVTSLMTQLEVSYSLTARVQQLTILNYLAA